MKKFLTVTTLALCASSAFAETTTSDYLVSIIDNKSSYNDRWQYVDIVLNNAKITQLWQSNTSFPLFTQPNGNIKDGCSVYKGNVRATDVVPQNTTIQSMLSDDLKIMDNRVYLNSSLYGKSESEMLNTKYSIICKRKPTDVNSKENIPGLEIKVQFVTTQSIQSDYVVSSGVPIASNNLYWSSDFGGDSSGAPKFLLGEWGVTESKTSLVETYLFAYVPSTGALYQKTIDPSSTNGVAQWLPTDKFINAYSLQLGNSYVIDTSLEKSIFDQVKVELYLGYLPVEKRNDKSQMKFLNITRKDIYGENPKGSFSSIGINPIFVSMPQ